MIDKSDLKKIFTFVQQLETRITELESKDAVIVEGSKKNNQPKPLQIALDKLIDLYNDIPQVLAAYAVEVSLNSETYRQKNPQNIILEPLIRGKYWVILLENNYGKKYYLFPNPLVKIKLYRTKSINYLFDLTGAIANNMDSFTLIKPAELNILPSGQQWKLIKVGELYIGSKSSGLEIVSEVEEITKKQEKTTATIQDLISILKKINSQNTRFEKTLKKLETRLEKLEVNENKLIDVEHHKSNNFAKSSKKKQKLTVSNQTINNILQGNTKDIYLEVSIHGEYIYQPGEEFDYLFPNPYVIFDKKTLSLANQSKLFVAHNEIPVAILGQDIHIIRPAQITKVNNLWMLIKSGEIKF